MTTQAPSRDLDTDNLVLLVDHLGKFVDLISSFVRTRWGGDHRGYRGGLLLGMVAALREAGMLREDLITHPMHDDQEVN